MDELTSKLVDAMLFDFHITKEKACSCRIWSVGLFRQILQQVIEEVRTLYNAD